MDAIRKTRPALHLTVIRILSALPLLIIGTMHLVGQAPMLPILQGAGVVLPQLLASTVPILEVLAGLSLLIGFYARVGASITVVTMAGAIYSHWVHDWADEPVIILPIAVLVGVLQVLWGGAGAFSSDIAAS